MRLNPGSHAALNNLGYSCYLQRNFKEAIGYFNQAIQRHPQKQTYQNNLGLCYAEEGEVKKAMDAFILAGNLSMAAKMEARLSASGAEKASEPEPVLTRDADGGKREQPISETTLTMEPVPVAPQKVETPLSSEALEIAKVSPPVEIKRMPLAVKKGMGIEVSNGNGESGMAKDLGVYLTHHGFPIARMTNAPHFNFETTKIFYRKGYLAIATDMARKLSSQHQSQPAMRLIESNKLRERVKLLIGKDLIPLKNEFSKEELASK